MMTSFRTLLLAAALAPCCMSAALAQNSPKPAFDHRRLIADNLAKMFSADANVRNVSVSEIRSVTSPVGLTWGTCVRVGAATSISGTQTLPRTYVVTFTLRNQIAERREA